MLKIECTQLYEQCITLKRENDEIPIIPKKEDFKHLNEKLEGNKTGSQRNKRYRERQKIYIEELKKSIEQYKTLLSEMLQDKHEPFILDEDNLHAINDSETECIDTSLDDMPPLIIIRTDDEIGDPEIGFFTFIATERPYSFK